MMQQNNMEAFITGTHPQEVYTKITTQYRGWVRAAVGITGT